MHGWLIFSYIFGALPDFSSVKRSQEALNNNKNTASVVLQTRSNSLLFCI